MANNVIFKFGTKAQYDALETKNENTLYWLSDVLELRKGDKLFGTGKEATDELAGLMSAEDKAKLDSITDNGITVIPEYTIEKQAISSNNYAATYKLKMTVGDQASYVGDEINIPKDLVLQSGSVKTVTTADEPYPGAVVGDSYMDLVLSDPANTHLYTPVKDLFDAYIEGPGIKIENNTISVAIDAAHANGLMVSDAGLGIGLATASTAGAMSAVDKVTLDTLYSDMAAVKADIADLKTAGVAGGILWEDM